MGKKINFFELISVYLLQITTSLTIFLAVNFSQSELFAQSDKFSEIDESGAIILNRSIDTISRLVRVECNLRISTFINGAEFPANGKYEEQAVAASGLEKNKDKDKNDTSSNSDKRQLSEFQRTMYRQELNFVMDAISVQTEPNRVILVCYPNRGDSKNGNIWQFRSINGNKTLHQINIDAVEAAIKRSVGKLNNGASVSGQNGVNRGVAADARRFSQVGMLWNVGGIAGVLGQIDRFYEFTELPKVEIIDNVKTIKLVGSMRKAYFEILLKNHGGLENSGSYPSNLPCDIEVYIGLDNNFPRKIRYINRKNEKSKPTNLLVEINYVDIIINGDSIPEHRFSTFQNEVPAGVSKIDVSTEQYIKSLGLE